MNCPKCGHPEAECIIGNYWNCPGCDDQKKLLGLVKKLADNPIPLIHRSFESDDPTAMQTELLEAVMEFEVSNDRYPSFVTMSERTYERLSEAFGYRPQFIRAAKVKPIPFMAHGVYVVS